MTSHERVFYETFVGHIELREESVRRGELALERACVIRNGIGLLAVLFVVLRLVDMSGHAPWLDWIGIHGNTIAVALVAILLFAAANQWCARQRLQESKADLLAFIQLLPLPAEMTRRCAHAHYARDRATLAI